MSLRTPPIRFLLLLLLALLFVLECSNAHAGHDHHDHNHAAHDHHHHHGAAAVKSAIDTAERRKPPSVEHAADAVAADHHHDHDKASVHDHDHDHDHTNHDVHRTLKDSAVHHHGDHHDHRVHHHDDHHGHSHDHKDHGHAHDHKGHGHAPAANAAPPIDRFALHIWAEALFATALVGAAPVLVLFFVPLGVGNHEAQKPLLRVFLSFAAGGLLGDALLHLLPHSMPHSHDHSNHAGHDHNHDDDHPGHSHSLQDLSVWLWTIAGMMTFLLLEKFVRAQTGSGHGHSHAGSSGHSHSHNSSSAIQDGSIKRTDADADASTARKRKGTKDATTADAAHSSTATSTAAPSDNKRATTTTTQPIAAAGYLNLAADFAHNFTDGLAIGATFVRGSGWTTTVAMLLHELPHEIGDFAILIQSGFTRREAMLTQLLTAIGAMVGTVIGLLMEGAGNGDGSSAAWISPFTAGGFIYIACASVMPELLDDCSLVQSLKETAAMAVGVGLMVLIALNE